jgi:hypothetical protein
VFILPAVFAAANCFFPLLLLLCAQYALPGSAGTFIDVTTDEDLQDMVRGSGPASQSLLHVSQHAANTQLTTLAATWLCS